MQKGLFLLGMALMGCNGDKGEELIPLLTGSIAPDHPDYNVAGEFTGYRAFAFDDQGIFWAYISSNPETHCGDAVNYLQVNGDRYNPEEVLAPGKCNILIKLTDWNENFSASDDPLLAASTAIECAMGEGTFELMTLDTNDKDYFWTGQWWQGAPREFEWNFVGTRDEGYTLDINMSAYSGGFVHEEMLKYDAFGEVSGVMEAYVCEGLASTGL